MMKIETYKEVYYQPIRQISVPQALQNQPFEVFFVPIVRDDLPKSKNSPNPLLKGLGVMHDDGNSDKLSVNEFLKAITIKTDKVATIEEMNQSIAQAYKHWEG